MKMRRKHAKRVSAGGVEAWRAAFTELRRHRRDLLYALPGFVGFLVVVNLPWLPAYERGLLTGAALVIALWTVVWLVWVTSGLSLRLNGVWAEEAINEQLAASPKIYGVVPSVKMGGYDVDTVAVSRGAVLAVETKWSLREANDSYVDRVAHQAARGCRTLRHELAGEELPTDLIQAVVVLCGPGAREATPRIQQVQMGWVTEVAVVGALHLDAWLADHRGGHIGPDFADRLLRDLRTLAEQRDRTAIQAGWVVRRFARIN